MNSRGSMALCKAWAAEIGGGFGGGVATFGTSVTESKYWTMLASVIPCSRSSCRSCLFSSTTLLAAAATSVVAKMPWRSNDHIRSSSPLRYALFLARDSLCFSLERSFWRITVSCNCRSFCWTKKEHSCEIMIQKNVTLDGQWVNLPGYLTFSQLGRPKWLIVVNVLTDAEITGKLRQCLE